MDYKFWEKHPYEEEDFSENYKLKGVETLRYIPKVYKETEEKVKVSNSWK